MNGNSAFTPARDCKSSKTALRFGRISGSIASWMPIKGFFFSRTGLASIAILGVAGVCARRRDGPASVAPAPTADNLRKARRFMRRASSAAAAKSSRWGAADWSRYEPYQKKYIEKLIEKDVRLAFGHATTSVHEKDAAGMEDSPHFRRGRRIIASWASGCLVRQSTPYPTKKVRAIHQRENLVFVFGP